MNGLRDKEYGAHQYADHDGTSDCVYGCGCWMGPCNSGGPLGLDPGGSCPNNPKDGQLLGGKADYECVVSQRIRSLETRLYRAEEKLRRVKPSKMQLAEELQKSNNRLAHLHGLFCQILKLVQSGLAVLQPEAKE